MKKLLLLTFALSLFACTSDSEGNPCIYEPTLETNAVTDITETSATLNGVISIVSENCDVPNNTEQGFVYSTEIQPTLEDTQVNVNGTNISTTIEGLTPNTTYYVRAFLTNNLGDFYGDEVSFTTVAGQILLNTLPISNITTNTATTGGELLSDGNTIITAKGVCWSLTNSPTIDDNFSNNYDSTTTFESIIEGLSPNTEYFVRAFATNEFGTYYGNELIIFTLSGEIILETGEAYDITIDNAFINCNIISDGGAEVIEKGICWNLDGNPTIADQINTQGSGSDNYTADLSMLENYTDYYARAFATNSTGTYYGNEIEFKTLAAVGTTDTFTDEYGNEYGMVLMCDGAWWTTNNLNVSYYNNGDPIPEIQDQSEWGYAEEGAWCFHNNNQGNESTHGRIYNWYTIGDERGIAPDGWEIISVDHWSNLIDCLGGDVGKIRSLNWDIDTNPNCWPGDEPTNESGLYIDPCRSRGWSGNFQNSTWTDQNGNVIIMQETSLWTTSNTIGLACCRDRINIGVCSSGIQTSADLSSGGYIRLRKEQ